MADTTGFVAQAPTRAKILLAANSSIAGTGSFITQRKMIAAINAILLRDAGCFFQGG